MDNSQNMLKISEENRRMLHMLEHEASKVIDATKVKTNKSAEEINLATHEQTSICSNKVNTYVSFDEDPEEIRDSMDAKFLTLDNREKLGDHKENLDDTLESINEFEYSRLLQPIELESPPRVNPEIFSDEEKSPPNLPPFNHRDSILLTRSTTALSTTQTSEDSDSDHSIEEIDVLDLLQVKTPTTKMEEDLKLKKENNSNRRQRRDMRRFFTL